MINNSATHTFTINNVSLNAFLVSLHGDEIPDYISGTIQEAFTGFAPFLSDETQVMYVRDIKELAICGKWAGGHCYNRWEAMISVPNWNIDKPQLVAAINHELHHLARWQNAGYGETLGGALVSEGIATYYEQLCSGWSSPWSQANVSKKIALQAFAQWDDANYDHNQWFFEGQYGPWAGYGLGMMFAQDLYKQAFNLKDSLLITADDAKSHFNLLVQSL